MKNMKWFIGLVPFALMGCGGDDGTLTQGGSASAAQMQQASVVQAIGGFLSLTKVNPGTVATLPGNALPGGVGILSVGPFATPYDDCKEVLADDDTDTDNDLIPRHVKIRYNCLNVASTTPGVTTKGKLIGTFEKKDLKDIDASTKYADGGYEFNYDLLQVDADIPGPGIPPWEMSWKGSHSARPTSSTLTFATDYEWWYKGFDGGPVKWFRLDWGGKIQNESVYTPVSMANPFANGAVKHSGLYKMEGYVGSDMHGRDLGHVSVTFKISSKDLVYKSSCAEYYDSGEMTFEGSPGTKLTLKFSCTAVDAFFNGQPITMAL